MKRLIITTTHGNEQFAVPVVEELNRKYQFDRITGNPRATKGTVRYVEADLNRSGPGNPESDIYEVRRAWEVIQKASEYDEVIDIHGTVSDSGLFVILSDPNWRNIELAKKINLERVVLWPSLLPKGPLTQFIPSSLEIECGPKDSQEVSEKLKQVLEDYLNNKPIQVEQEFYIVTGQLNGNVDNPLKDFQLAKINGKEFYPLLVDQYPGIKCYTLQKLVNTLSYSNS